MDESVGPCAFACFQGMSAWTNGPESSSRVSPATGIGPWMGLPSFRKLSGTFLELLETSLFALLIVLLWFGPCA